MAEQKEAPRPHGDPLAHEVVEPNRAQRDNDATGDIVGQRPGSEAPTAGITSTANGTPAFDEAEAERRRKLYDDGAELVSKID